MKTSIFRLKLSIYLYIIKYEIISFFKRNISRIRVRWYRDFVPEDEFHVSLNLDQDALLYLPEKEKDKYLRNLTRRRNLAHVRSLNG